MSKDLPIEKKLLEALLKKGKELLENEEIMPPYALIRLLRMGLSMTQRQLAKRAQVQHSTILRIEKGDIRPNEETLRKIFGALECDLAFIPVPRFKNIDALLRKRARNIAEKRLRRLEGTMALEQQLPEETWQRRLLENEIELILKTPSKIWNEDAI